MDLTHIRHLVSDQQQATDECIIASLSSQVSLIEDIGHYIINSGGKRLRPLIVLLSALTCGYQGQQHIQLAAIIEFIHTATLLHDDVVDESTLRRGRETANAIWDDHSSVLVGDFLYSRAFQMMVSLNNMQIMQIIADTTNQISEGEVLQLLNAHNADTSEQHYLTIIKYKTAILFAACAKLGAIISNNDQMIHNALENYGLNLGMAFQLVDDVLDYSEDATTIGKNIGDDLAEGKPTLPLIRLLQQGTEAQKKLVRAAIKQGTRQHLNEIQQAIHQSGTIAYTIEKAQYYASQAINALQPLPTSDYQQALISLAHFAVQRTF